MPSIWLVDGHTFASMLPLHEVKNTTKNPIQLPTTPIAEYELMNMSGKNSYFAPKMSWCTSEQYAMSGIATAM